MWNRSKTMDAGLKRLYEQLRSGRVHRAGEDSIDEFLQNLLSVLAELDDWELANDEDTTASTSKSTKNEDLVTVASSILLEPSPTTPDFSSSSRVSQVWQSGWRMIASEILLGASLTLTRTIHATATMASLHFSNTNAFISTCIILSCFSLRCFAQSNDPVLKLPRRWKSIIFETLRGFQCSIPSLKSIISQNLCCNCLIPAINVAHYKLRDILTEEDMRVFSIPLQAAVIQCLAVIAMKFATDPSVLYRSILDLVIGDPIQYLSGHCWRRVHRERILTSNNLDKDMVFLTRLTTFSENSDDGSSDEEEDADLIGLETEWPDQGIALLLTSKACLETRPYLWSGLHQWCIFFPYVAEVMKGELEIQSNTLVSNGNRMCAFLNQLLLQLPRHTLTSPRVDDSPDHPFPVFQWLVNAMVQGSKSVGVKNPSIYYQRMNALVSRYHPESQLYLVARTVYPRCPYPAVKPKIVDLLRNHSQWKESMVALRHRFWEFVELSLLDEQNWEHEELLIAFLGLYDISLPTQTGRVLDRLENAFRDGHLDLPFVSFTIERIRARIAMDTT